MNQKYTKSVLFQRVHVQKILGPIFWRKKNACGKTVVGMVLLRRTWKWMELFFFVCIGSGRFGTDLGHYGEFIRRKMMIGLWRTRLNRSRGLNIP